MVTFVAGTGLLAVSLIGIGLLLGGLFKTAAQVYTWSSVVLLPIIMPAFVAGLPVPDALDLALRAFPTLPGHAHHDQRTRGQSRSSPMLDLVSRCWSRGS